jgi:hypothetical protein
MIGDRVILSKVINDYLLKSTDTAIDSPTIYITLQHLLELHIPSRLKADIIKDAMIVDFREEVTHGKNSK